MAGTTFSRPFGGGGGGGGGGVEAKDALADWRGAGSETLLAAWQAFTNAGQVRVIRKDTTAGFNALTPNANTVYIVSD